MIGLCYPSDGMLIGLDGLSFFSDVGVLIILATPVMTIYVLWRIFVPPSDLPAANMLGLDPEAEIGNRAVLLVRNSDLETSPVCRTSGNDSDLLKARRRSRARLRGLNFTIPRRRIRNQRPKQFVCGLSHLIHRPIESDFVCFRRLSKPTQLTNKLQRRRSNLFFGCRWLEIVKRLDISTHAVLLPCSRKKLRASIVPNVRKAISKERGKSRDRSSDADGDLCLLAPPSATQLLDIGIADIRPGAGFFIREGKTVLCCLRDTSLHF